MIIEWRAKNWSRRLMRWRADKIICNLHLWWLMAHRGPHIYRNMKIKYQFCSFMTFSSLENMHIKFALSEARLSSLKYENFRYPITGSRILYFYIYILDFFFFHLESLSYLWWRWWQWMNRNPSENDEKCWRGEWHEKCINILPRARKSFHRNENSISQFEK